MLPCRNSGATLFIKEGSSKLLEPISGIPYHLLQVSLEDEDKRRRASSLLVGRVTYVLVPFNHGGSDPRQP